MRGGVRGIAGYVARFRGAGTAPARTFRENLVSLWLRDSRARWVPVRRLLQVVRRTRSTAAVGACLGIGRGVGPFSILGIYT
jgi:hypothetical protein